MKSHLKVKVYSLSTEMSFIRRQEEKWKNKARLARLKSHKTYNPNPIIYAENNFWSLRDHRNGLKTEARTAHLAYGAMRGIPYAKMEYICYSAIKGYNRQPPDWEAIAATVERFSKDELHRAEIMQRFEEWLADAKKWHDGNPDRIERHWTQCEAFRQAKKNDPAHQAQLQERNRRAREAGLGASKAA